MSENSEKEATEPVAHRASAQDRVSTLRRLCRNPQAAVTAAVLSVIVVAGLLATVISSHGPNAASLDAINASPGTPGYPLGADKDGRDVLALLLHSINTSAVTALIATSIALAVGVPAGLIGGYFGSRVHATTEWLFNLIMTFPGLLLLIVLMPVTKGDFRATMALFGVLLSPSIFRIVRNHVLGVKNELFVDAARVSGLPDHRILARHVLFAVRGPVIIAAAFLTGTAIGVQAGLAFLGVGNSEVPSFGTMIASGFTNLYVAPTQFAFPSLLLGVITASLVLFGNALRDTLEGSPRRPQPIVSPTPPTAPGAGAGGEGLLTVADLTIAYDSPAGEPTEVVCGTDFTLQAGETLGLVGESGSGKTQTAFALLGVLPPEARVARGSVRLDGRELLGLGEREMRAVRGHSIAYVPQEPMSNLDPSLTVGAQLAVSVRAVQPMSRGEARRRVLALLGQVGIPDPERVAGCYPHQISGGMAQRVLIAGAVAGRPQILIADEPTTALDVTVQAEILDLLHDLRKRLNLAVVLVTHDFGMVADFCDRVAVMRGGEIVETGSTAEIFAAPRHDYTRMLLDAILDADTVRTDAPAGGRTA
ncbi:dipeptide/oligopeptide/nickel ABC transporter permease/ATP-binding protein [Streptomyces sp. NL15-2K]|uniref:dipeptide/oligopeptide/nickel ABC transporter permease/ATP-binding protein n=1 Tax=Streptomyces sp. NL15-2K TaxID=376149 RepID=UPI000F575887|nr:MULTISPECIES: dipeptide/oligopeptide/nickel ABC transporter permease/ATP-binding protein [Actinomycetes]WKX15448.1 dipeptide/oligopeptide/nickel ABC transporter permease/ATP-binding protein [Kutzneria buriramensis]GCB52633.1 oligopeptide transport system permease protein oppB [Streptomyces sp. NL15-2K]